MRVEKYFAYQHLPEHLQVVSKPFAECINNLSTDTNVGQSVYDLMQIVANSKSVSNDIEETDLAIYKLIKAHEYLLANENIMWVQQLILEAKDCAVRAAIK